MIFSVKSREGRYTMIGVTRFPLNDRTLILPGKNNTQKKKKSEHGGRYKQHQSDGLYPSVVLLDRCL